MSATDRRSSGRKVRLDATLKSKILKDNAVGLDPEEIAIRYDIHAEYVRRVVKKAIGDSQKTPVKLPEEQDPLTAPSPRSAKKLKTQTVGDENENRSHRRSGKKRKVESESESEAAGSCAKDVEMAEAHEVMMQPTRRSLMSSMTAAAAVRHKADPVVAKTAEACLSPHQPHTTKNSATQTAQTGSYEQEYIDYMEKTHAAAIKAKDKELADQRRKIAALNGMVHKLETDLKESNQKSVLEKGWKKNF